jgi:proteasome alpha subunit
MGGQADQVAAVLKDHYEDGLPLVRALGAAIAGLAGQGGQANGNGNSAELSASQLEVGILARDRAHRTFRRLTGARLEVLLAEAAGGDTAAPATPEADEPQPGEAASPDDGVTP